MKSTAAAAKLLKKLWSRLRLKDARTWSLREVARELKVSPGYLSKVLSNQKPLSKKFALKLIRTLRVDELNKTTVLSFFDEGSAKAKRTRPTARIEAYELPPESAEWLLGKWFRLCLLDLMTTSDFKSDPNWMAERLGISSAEIEDTLKKLLAEGLAVVDQSGRYQKKHRFIRFPAAISKQSIRDHHKAQMKRATLELDTKIAPKDFAQRLIVGLSLACDPEKLSEVKGLLQNALYEAAEKLSDGNCTEVFQLNLQLFPQTSSPTESASKAIKVSSQVSKEVSLPFRKV
jgi:uncharacterized protein (TIGR02147 family)